MHFKRLTLQPRMAFSPVTRLVLLLLFTGCLLLFKQHQTENTMLYEASPTDAMHYVLKQNEFATLALKPSGDAQKKFLIQITSNKPVLLNVSGKSSTFDRHELNANTPDCIAHQNTFTCSVFESSRSLESKFIRFTAQSDDTEIKLNQIKLLSVTPKIQFDESYYLLILAVFILPLPFIWFMHNQRKTTEWLIVLVAVTCLSLVQPFFTVCLMIFLYSMFSFGKYFFVKKRRASGLIWPAILVSLLFLIQGKYSYDMLNAIFPQYGNTNIGVPLGISYFVIRLMDALLSWYRGENQDVSFREFLCYIIFPATIPAGPIETLSGFQSNRLENFTRVDLAYGLGRVIIGIFKKVVIASYFISPMVSELLGPVVTQTSLAPNQNTVMFLFLSFLYAYVDFSAYSDIAIGASRLYGYRMIENFTWPIFAHNLHGFWRSWHRSLSLWCFRNIYFPLTINTRNTYVPLFITMAIVGLWHVFGLSWFSWSLYHATGLCVLTLMQRKKVKFIQHKVLSYLIYPFKTLLTLTFVAAGYSFVVFDNVELAYRAFLTYWITIFSCGIVS